MGCRTKGVSPNGVLEQGVKSFVTRMLRHDVLIQVRVQDYVFVYLRCVTQPYEQISICTLCNAHIWLPGIHIIYQLKD